MKAISRRVNYAAVRLFLGGFLMSIALASTVLSHAPLLAQSDARPSTVAVAPVPRLIRFSGTLIDGRGWPIASPIAVTFAIYSQPAGKEQPALWQETQQISPNSRGSYAVLLGSASRDGVPVEVFKPGESQYLSIKPDGEPEQARVLLVSVPYALKAADAATLGGLPPSAFALAGGKPGATALPEAASISPAIHPDLVGNVTTTGGTSGYLPVFNGASTVVDSILYATATGIGVGEVPNSTAVFDVNGKSIWRGLLNISRAGTATAAGGFDSYPLLFQASAFDSADKTAFSPAFELQAEPAGNDTASPGATFNLLYSNNSGTPSETGLSFNSNGTIHFAAGQTFPGTGAGTITGVAAGSDLVGGGTSGIVTLRLDTGKVPLLNSANTFTANQTVTGIISATGDVSAQGQLISKTANGTPPLLVSSSTLVANLNASLLDGLAPSAFAEVSGSNSFNSTQTFHGTNGPSEGSGYAAGTDGIQTAGGDGDSAASGISAYGGSGTENPYRNLPMAATVETFPAAMAIWPATESMLLSAPLTTAAFPAMPATFTATSLSAAPSPPAPKTSKSTIRSIRQTSICFMPRSNRRR